MLTKNDVARLGKNFGHMIRGLSRDNVQETDFVKHGITVLDHHFDDHQYCGLWCPRKRMMQQQLAASPQFYRCKEKDAKLYAMLSGMLSQFITLDKLKDVAHRMDTQVNESFNKAIAWLAPKNKVYCGSPSLENRVGMAIGIKSIGVQQYFERLFKELGIEVTPSGTHYLKMKGDNRNRWLAKTKTKEQKKMVKKKYFLDLQRHEQVAQQQRKKREGTYKSGQNMDGEDGVDVAQAGPPKKKSKMDGDMECCLCGLKGYTTSRSKACLHYKGGKDKATGMHNLNGPLDPVEDTLDFDSLPVGTEAEESVITTLLVEAAAPEHDHTMCNLDGEDTYNETHGPVII
jgi:hypothetical protein